MNKVDINTESPRTAFTTTRPVKEEKPSLWSEVKETSLKIAEFMEKVIWPYIREANTIAKRTIKAVALGFSHLNAKLNPIISKMGILSAISVLLTLKEFPHHVSSLIEHIRNKDGEGIALAAISLLENPLSALDSLITSMDSLAAFGLVPTITFFSLIAMPLAIGLVGYAAIKGVYNIVRCGINLHALPKSLKEDNVENFKAYLEEKIEVTAKEREGVIARYKAKGELDETSLKKIDREIRIIKDRKRNILTRHTDAKVYNIMKNTLLHLNKEDADLGTANKALRDMKKIMVRKIGSGSVGVAANLAFLTTLVSSLVFPISAFAIPVVAGLRALLAIGRHHYEHVWMDKGLELPEFVKPN